MTTIKWTPEMLRRFKREYKKHENEPKGTFRFDDNEFLVGYAKYLIEYLEGVFRVRR